MAGVIYDNFFGEGSEIVMRLVFTTVGAGWKGNGSMPGRHQDCRTLVHEPRSRKLRPDDIPTIRKSPPPPT